MGLLDLDTDDMTPPSKKCKLQRNRSDSPAPSCVSMKSDASMDPPYANFKNGNPPCGHSKLQRKRSDSPAPSCVSMKSDASMDPPYANFTSGVSIFRHSKLQRKRSDSPAPSCVSMKSDASMDPPYANFTSGVSIFRHSKLQRKRSDSPAPSCVSMKSDASMDPPYANLKNGNPPCVHRVLQKAADGIEKNVITDTGHDPESAAVNESQKKFKLNLMEKFQCLNGVIINQDTRTLLNEIYTELYITEGDSGDVSKEHEVRQIEAASRRTTAEETPIKCNDIFKPLSEQDEPIRTVLTKGVAGIGKTVSVQKFILDWAEGKANQDLHLIFPLPFRELNLMKDQKLSLMDLLHVCFKETNETEMSSVKKVLFIFDGLDECRFPLDFQNTVRVCDVNESASVHVLLINLIKGNLLPSALIWITSRPAAADQIPSEYVHRVTEVRGFNDPQKEEYFRKRISDQSLANNIITHLKSLRSLYIMCHIPVFCWISATVLERVLSEAESGEIPKTLTQMYTHFLIIQTNIIREKYSKKQESDEEMLLKLGQLAFQQLQKGNLIFYEEDLRECGIDVTEAAVYSGVCTQIFREEFGLHQSKVYSFVHLSIQEHLAALYVHLTFMKEKRNALVQSRVFKTISDVHESAVDQALECASGHLDLFLRFLLGLSLESNQKLLHALVTQTGSSSQTENRKTVQYIKKKISRDVSTEKSINLFHCLNELGDSSLVEEIQRYLKSGKQRKLSSSQWSALVFVLLTSAQELEEFDLSKYITTDKIREEIVVKVMPVIAASRKAIIRCDTIQERSWSALASVLNSDTSNLKELHLTVNTLDLSENKLGDSGVKNLSALLENPHCKVKHLRLRGCGVSDEGCAALTSALKSNPSHLRDLDLSENNLGDSGVKCVSAVLENPHCKLEILSLRGCGVSDEGCAALASALRSNPSHLRELELSQNNLGDSGVKRLYALLENPHCKLEILRLHSCGVSDEGCAALASALKSNPSHLRELYLCQNKLGESCGKCLSALLENPDCKLEKLRLRGCDVSDGGCASLASALRSNPSHLRHLELGENNLGDSGVKCLSAVLENPDCKLEILWLRRCGVSDEGCAALASALRSNPSHLRDLELSENKLGASGVKCLSAVLENPHCKLEILRLNVCGVSDEGCAALASALRSNPSHLRELYLSQNKIGYTGVKCLSDLKNDEHYKLQTLGVLQKSGDRREKNIITDTGKQQRKRSDSPEPSCVSMKSDKSVEPPSNFRNGNSSSVPRVLQKSGDRREKNIITDTGKQQRKRSDSPEPSCVSMKSDKSVEPPSNFRNGNSSSVPRVLQKSGDRREKNIITDTGKQQRKRSDSPEPSCVSMKSDKSVEPPSNFRNGNSSSVPRVLQKSGDRREKNIITDTGHDPESAAVNEFQKKFKLNLMKKFQCLNGVIINQDTRTLLNEIYTELYITEGDSGDVNKEHEVRQIEAASRRTTTEETPIKCSDIFKPLSEQDEPIRTVLKKTSSEKDKPITTVLTKGVAGIGKTVSVQKFILDWAEGKANQDFHLIFPLPFRELNLMKDQKLSLMDLLHVCFKETKETEMFSLKKCLFIFDGLDECRFPLDFQTTVRVCDVNESASVHVLLINLIKGNLLPSALIWITSRPAAAEQIPSEYVHRVTEVRGFNDPQKEEYFRKRISDRSLANNIITHLKSLRSLYIMCHIPVFCWISSTVLERVLSEAESGEIPKTLTQMYTHFLIIQTNIIREKYSKKQESDEEMLLKLGQLAFQQLQKGNLIFYEEDLRQCGIDVTEAAVYSGVCTQIFREEFGLHQSKVYCFVHLSLQEHLAALYVHLTFMKEKRNVLEMLSYPEMSSHPEMFSDPEMFSEQWIEHNTISDVHISAVDQALESTSGHLDLFLRFLLGLSLESNQKLLHALVTQTGSSSQTENSETVQYIKRKISRDVSTEKSINLFHCLNELGDNSLVEEIQRYLKSGKQRKLSSSQWSALVFVLLSSAQELEEFDLSKYTSTDKIREEIVVKVMPVIAASRKAIIRCDTIQERSWSALASVLNSDTSNLRELHLTVNTLDLSENKLGDSGVKNLSALLENPHCKVKHLRLRGCGVSDEGCAALTSALRSNPSHLRDLELSENNLGDSGVKCVSAVLENPHCKLEILCLRSCGVSDEGCAALTSALRSNPSHLRELELSQNNLGDSGVKCLSAVLENPHCKLEILRLHSCGVSDEGCAALTSALRSNPSHLRELNLCQNKLGESCGTCLSALLENPHCKLVKLSLRGCGVSDEGCAALASALRSNPSHLRHLELSQNNLGDSGVKCLSAVLENPHCKLEILWLRRCDVSDEGCAALASALRSNPSNLRDLELSENNLGDSGVKCVSALLENPHCKLEILRLRYCGVSDEGCAALTSALRSNPSHLRDLYLYGNNLGDSGMKCLSALKNDKHYKLQTLIVLQKSGDRREKIIITATGHDPESAAVNEFQKKLKLNLMKKFQRLNGVIINQENRTLLNEIYTELYITEGESGDINKEHEVRQIEAASRRTTTEETPIKCNDIFKPLPEQDKPIRTVLTKGVAGIGKTVSVQKFILDWAEGKANQDLHLIFPLPFRELNLMKEKLSLMDLLHVCFKETKETEMFSVKKVLLIFDGLDECRFPLDFQTTVRVCDVNESASVHVLVINLIKGNLLPSALIWITSRPAAADQIPSEYVHRVTEIRGFNDPQKEEYFRKRISDQSLANNIITHLKSLRSLYIMCHIPVFCWISSTVLERVLNEAESGEIPKTLTQMYTHFLIIQTNIIREKYSKKQESDEEMLLKLGQLAFQQLQKGNLIFYEEDLRECGIDVTEAAVYSGVCTQIFREEFGLHQSKVYCFVHLSIQEHLAALYVHLTFMKEKRYVLEMSSHPEMFSDPEMFSEQWIEHNTISDVHISAVDQALETETGHLDLFLRFLLGLSLESNQKLLHALVTQTGSSSQTENRETVQYIKEMVSEDLPTEKSINLFYCLNELGDSSLVEEIQRYLKSGKQSELSSSQWSALVFVLLTSAQELEEFDLSKYTSTDKIRDEIVVKVMPVIAASRKAIIRCDTIQERSWSALASVLNSDTSNLRELHLTVATLDLSENKLGDSGVKNLSALLENPHCKVKHLRLRGCGVSDEGCAALTSALRSNPSHLRVLDLSWNNLGNSGVKCLSALLENPHCKLEILRLIGCDVSNEGCAALTSALKSNPSHLRDLDLSENNLGDSGVKSLSAVLENPHCKLEILWLRGCGVSDEGCAALTSALKSNPSHLRELNLCQNKLGESCGKCLYALLENPDCKLEILRFCSCDVSDEHCAALTSALKSNPSNLRELDLSGRNLGDSGVKCVSAVLENPHCKLEILRLVRCGVSDEGCAALTSALRSNPSHLRDLDLSENNLGDSGVKCLSSLLENHHCKLEILWLRRCGVSDEGCAALASALKSNPSHLRELNLCQNKLGESCGTCLYALLENPHCKLEILRFCSCGVSDEHCAALTSALKSNPSNLRELNLSGRNLGDSGVKCVSAVLENPHCKLEILRLIGCGVSDEGCAALTSALRSNPSHLRDLDLSENNLGDSGVKCLSSLLENHQCKLEILWLRRCGVSDEGCAALASALKSNPSHLRELNLCQNKLGESCGTCLYALLENPHCKLEILRFCSCGVSDEHCAALTSALKSNPSNLRELNLSGRNLGDSGVKCVSALLENPHCKLEILRLHGCGVSDEGCAALASALRSNPSHLRELELSQNKLGASGVKCVSAVLENPHCKLEILRFCGCGVSDEGCAALASALRSNPSHLRELDLSENNLGDSGVKCVSALLENPHCKLEILWLRRCGVSDEGCAALASALKSNPSHLRELNLCQNKLGESCGKCLYALLENPHCKLEILRFCSCDVSDEGCAALTSALRSNPLHLRELDLSWRNLGDSGVKCLSAVLENPHCKLEILRLIGCGVSDEGCAALTSALKSNPSNLRELNLSGNKLGDSGVKCLSGVLENPDCKLEKLRLVSCGVSDKGCAALTSALRSNPSHLRDLYLYGNNLGDSGMKCLSALKNDKHYKLQTLIVLQKSGDRREKNIITDTGKQQRRRSDSPEPSCVSMKSDESVEPPLNFRNGNSSSVPRVLQKSGDRREKNIITDTGKQQRRRSDSPEPSCVSMKSDASMEFPLNFRNGNSSSVPRVLQKSGDRREKNIITDTGHDPESAAVNEFQKKFKLNLMKKFQCLNGVIINQENRTLLNEIYTELYITEGDSGDVSKEHEVRQIEAASRRTTTEETPIKCNDIFKPLSEQDEPIRTVLTKGVAGIGKTVSVQKFILDWAEGKANQDLHLIFPLPFRELNLMKDQKLSLMDLLHVCFKETNETEMFSVKKVLFIFDGLDESRFPLDFQNTVRVCDVNESASVHVLLINLIKGNLLPSALIWITSRPAAADQIPSEYVHRVTEIRGFNDPQKEEYFRKRISDQSLANNIITHLKSLRSLYIMCHIPVFCWISATVLERVLSEAESGEIPKTLTQMYTHFLIIQTNIIREKYSKKQESDEEMLLKLGHLAFQQLQKGNLIFYEEDLRQCGIDVTEAAVYSGVCTQIFREEFGLHQSKVYCFVHLSIQEHLAALYVHLTFMKEKRNVLEMLSHPEMSSHPEMFSDPEMFSEQWLEHNTISDVHISAVDQALESTSGHLDLFLRFLLGLSLESNQKLLHALVTQTGSSSQTENRKTVQYIKKKISRDVSTEKSINLFHCLNELGDNSLVEETQRYLKSGKQRKLSSSQWSALVFVLLSSAHELEEFDLSKYTSTDKIREEIVVKVMPVIAASRKAIIRCDTIQERSWSALASVLNSDTSNLRELHLTVDTLDLSENKLGDSGVKNLSALLEHPHCKVKQLRLRGCGVSDEGCAALASALRSNPSHLRDLELSENNLGDSGVKCVSAVLENPHCKLEILCLRSCGVSDEGCAALASALRSNPSHLRELELSQNNLGDSGVKCLSAVLENPDCKLEILSLRGCGVSDEGCAALASALRSNPSHLRHLELGENNLGDSGVKCLSAVLENPDCKLEILWLRGCGVSDEGCAALASALRSNPSHLRDLELSENKLGASGVKCLSAVLENPHCKLEILRLRSCGVSDEGCAALASALRSNPSHLRDLELSGNRIGYTGVKCLSTLKNDEHYKLQTLGF
ncbi:uncharacterized protein LOC113534414 isoform X4 [Pangasianodon hypophthalmus]|uniref:uncharacterized protein LOC113534414 isoform X4 n=1 Tax=Pangasianodon hypophthalmus TaxID=310915 RepID=UPI0023073DA9|nr:uncharacterized protein LOC113534414 isoform X4 [Pangasianodon hypophthalmus]